MSDEIEKPNLCLACRRTFSDAEIEGASACPGCGSKGIPSDLRQSHTLTLSDHEWRHLFMWAERWGNRVSHEVPEALNIISGMAREARRQQPTLPPLTILADVQDLSTKLGRKAEVIELDGTTTTIYPERKH